MARILALIALFACIAVAFAAETEGEKKDDLQAAAGHYLGYGYGGYGGGYRGFYGGYPGFYRGGYGGYGGFFPRFGYGGFYG